MASCNVWGITKLNFCITSIQLFFSRFVSYTYIDILIGIVILQILQMAKRHIFLPIMQKMLQDASVSLFRWFENNPLKGNAAKCDFLVSTSQEVILNVNNFKIKSSDCEKLLGVKYDSKLSFDQHITDLC